MWSAEKCSEKADLSREKTARFFYEPYKIKVFNTIDFAKSMHYNPFAYISKKNREKDILKFVEVLIKNTSSSQQPSGDDFWVKAEKLLYTAYIAINEELAVIEQYEPNLYEAAVNLFGKSYEYTRKYREFQKMMKLQKKK